MSSSLDVTVTLSAVAVAELAEGEGVGVDVELVCVLGVVAGVEMASCAVAMAVSKNIAIKEVKNLLIKGCCFQSCDWLWRRDLEQTPGARVASAQMRAVVQAKWPNDYSA